MTRWAGAALSVLLALTSLSIGAQEQVPGPARVTLRRHFTPADQLTRRYEYVPFDLPDGTRRLRVSYDYDRAAGANVIDLGLFEPGPLDLGTRAFRGYSGGARSAVELAGDSATPGYRAGSLPPGRWNVLLGLYRVQSAGVEVTVTIETSPGGGAHEDGWVVPRQEAQNETRWYIGALHTHTVHSDGTVTVAEMLRLFAGRNFDFVAITDHNNTTHARDFARSDIEQQRRPLRIIGEEVTTPGGHASVWGLPAGGWVDFRVLPGDARIRDLVASARKQGAMFSINHPASECLGCGWRHEFVEGIDAVEISNGRHGEVEKALAIWDGLLKTGRRITGVGSSDWHGPPAPVDNANVRVRAAGLTLPAILDAIGGGRVIVMTNAEDATPEVSVRAGGQTAAIGDTLEVGPIRSLEVEVHAPAAAGGQLVVVANGERVMQVAFDARGIARAEPQSLPGYVRLEIVKADGSPLAYTNPVFLVQR